MKPSLQRRGNIAQVPGRNVARVKRGTSRQKWPIQKTSGVLPLSAAEVNRRRLSVTEPSTGTLRKITADVDPSAKIKLQLFPVDEITRIGLEKDGCNPYLELTLKARKKISSVIKHIHTKWGCSSIAVGEPMLVAYDAHLRYPTGSRRWTLKDTVITAGDVFTAVESPAIFRLSYGWFSTHEPQRVSSITPLHNCIKSESIQKSIETTEERVCLEVSTQVASTAHVDTEVNMGHNHERSSSPQVDDIINLSIGGLLSEASEMGKISVNELKSSQPVSLCTDISIGGFLSEASLHGKIHNNDNNEVVVDGRNMTGQPIQWDDSLTALSIGGLLSEASLQAKINNKSDLTATFISDSFGISSQLKSNPQVAKIDSGLSILDAEETCHAFAFRKFSSSSKNVRVSARASQDLSSNSFRFSPHLPEQVEKHGMLAEEASCPEPKMEPFLHPQQFGEDSRSLGLRGITWNESLGPFDLGNSMPWKVCDGGYI